MSDFVIPDDPDRPVAGQPIARRTATVRQGFVVPAAKGLRNRLQQYTGVLRADGTHVRESILWRADAQITFAPEKPQEGMYGRLSGTWLYGGLLFGHFGHFLAETTARLWALPEYRDRIDGIVFTPKWNHNAQDALEEYRSFLYALGVDVPVVSLEDPTRVEKLFVPMQGFGMFDLANGSPEFQAYIRGLGGYGVEPDGPEKIYISRTQVNAKRGALVGEDELERRLEAEGYATFHPQNHHFLVQIARYRAAKQVIAMDSSPLHLLALVGNAEQRVGVIPRREGGFGEMFVDQLRALSGAEAHLIDVLATNWGKEGTDKTNRDTWGEPDFVTMGRRLHEAGLIEGGLDWAPLSDEDRRASLERAEKANRKAFAEIAMKAA